MKSRRERKIAVILRENRSSLDFVDDSDPVITAATTPEPHENEFVQWQRDSVGGHVVLNVVRDAPAEGLNGKAEQSSLDRNAIPCWRVPFPGNVHEVRGSGR